MPYQVLLLDELQRAGVEVVFLNRPIGTSPEEDLLLQVQGMMAEYERAKILERSRRGKRHAARAGSVNVLCGAPYGYRYVGKHEGGGQARYEIDEEHARVVRQIFAWVGLERCSIGEVCRRLQAQADPQPKGKAVLGPHDGLGDPEEPGLQGPGAIRQDAGRPASPAFATSRGKSRKPRRAGRRLRHPRGRPHRHRGARPGRRGRVRGGGRTVPGESRGAAGRRRGAPAICCRGCWCAEPVATPTTASR